MFYCAFLSCVIVFPIYLISTAINTSKRKQAAAKRRAIEKGHVVTAVYSKRHYVDGAPNKAIDPHGHTSNVAIYEYEWKGKKYKFKMYDNNPSRTLTLYFVRNPRKATIESCLNESNTNWLLVYIIVTLVLHFILKS